MLMCERCGHENTADARFCSGCGSPLIPSEPAREERKVVTVLFADLVGFTGRAERLDPEDVRAMLSPYYARLRSELERFGGTVEKFIGDAVMALFGAPTAHEDDPERAVRAALAIRDAIAEDGELQVRIGITTGEALVALGARPSEGEGMASGDVVNTAARLQSAAPANGIVVDETTHRATERVIEHRAAEPVQAKGKADPIAVWEVVEARSRYGVDVVQDVSAPLVGRTRELELLVESLARVRAEQAPQLVTLVGTPGIGKSRLLYELFRAVEQQPDLIYWRQGRSLPYGEGLSFWALGEMVKAHAGIAENDAAGVAEEKLRRAVEASIDDATEAQWVTAQLRPLVGLSAEGELGGDRRSEAFTAWRRFFEALAERNPLVLVFEDLHWADQGLLDFVDHLVDWAGGVPILVLATARPELLSLRPGWGGGKPNAVTLSLSPLSEDETARLLHSLLDRSVLPAELQATLLQRAGGNPLYTEEFARLLTERGLSSDADLPLPESVQGIIAARLDGLSADQKSLLQDAAVVGKVFWLGAMTGIGSRESWAVEEALHELERRELVRRERRSSVAGEAQYSFRHLLVRDVAYGQIPRRLRVEKHRRAAEWLESLSPERSEDRSEMLAHHYRSAIEFAHAAGVSIDPFAAPARVAFREAGERAFALNAFATAERFYEVALELAPEPDPERPHLLFSRGLALALDARGDEQVFLQARDGLLALGDTEEAARAEVALVAHHWFASGREHAWPHLEAAEALVTHSAASPSKAVVLTDLARFSSLGDQGEKALRLAREALAMAEAFDLDEARVRALNVAGVSRVKLGDRGGLEDLERAIALARETSTPEIGRAYINLSSVLGELGELRRSIELHREGLALAERMGLPGVARWLRAECALDEYYLGHWDVALPAAEAFIAETEAGSPHYMEIVARDVRALIRLARGDAEAASSDADRSLRLARAAEDSQVLLPALADNAGLLLVTGSTDQAYALLDELFARVTAAERVFPAYWAPALARSLRERGRTEDFGEIERRASIETRWLDVGRAEAAGDLERVADTYSDIGVVPHEAEARLRLASRL
ncbi:MAG: AAA family ATPase, partial [Actinobacteria bacterium]|nr:AAA family ATPase [Actinomycetota bacterium]